MALVYTSMTTWPLKWFEKYHEVLRKKGVHYTFTEGHKTVQGQEKANLLVEPIYEGYTVRLFCFAAEKDGETFLGMIYQNDQFWSGRVFVTDGVAKTQSGTYDPVDFGEEVHVGDIYTLAVRTDDIKGVIVYFNDRSSQYINLKKLDDGSKKYSLWMKSGNHYILSMHVYDELEKDRTRHLGDRLYLSELRLPVGAYGTYAVAYTGTTEAVTVTAKQHPTDRSFKFENNGRLKTGAIFHCIVRITAYGLAVSVSFDPDHKFEPAVGNVIWLRCCFDYGSIQNAHIVSPS